MSNSTPIQQPSQDTSGQSNKPTKKQLAYQFAKDMVMLVLGIIVFLVLCLLLNLYDNVIGLDPGSPWW